ncbi:MULTISPECIES: universal stress protein [unclassified Brenneria]|uniref:universal stress protein n=1 Tax=unclassified Brenneria TaxID=2634434 RepID=UPI0015560ED3|nr:MULTISPECIES: universal stress protein [unclassified Brenneria]MBJ7223747.1 universal stress protein [Brenneria sp. L3-3C-1]MEE3644990.1 universal stress protein [Brenneria sp. L3_3C_1]MEE3652259.1 universal stress protein [Brenneria sp. HEZEL_4_2_4]NPD02217.1 universal stress protein [Brenneria sp. hezel4-2-4]
MYQSVLLPVDISEQELTEKSLQQAKFLMERTQASLRLLYVRSAVPDYILNRFNPKTQQFEDTLDTEIKQKLKVFADELALPEERFTINVRQGSIYDEILKEAEAIGADLIVIGSRRPSVTTYLLGSNASAIVRYAKTSVLVAR